MFRWIQKLRSIRHRPPADIERLHAEFNARQAACQEAGELAIRDTIRIRVADESREPFEWFCWRSPEMVRELDAFICHTDGADSFLDIGANHGIFSLVFLKQNPTAKVISVDPSPVAGEVRALNRELNEMAGLVSLDIACGASAGKLKMKLKWHHLEASVDPSEGDIEVELQTLDSICAKHTMIPEVMKIDVEGYELEVLKGAEKCLSQARLLFLEIHPEFLDRLGVSQAAIFERLAERGWEVADLNGKAFDVERFAHPIHTFWTICRRRALHH